MPHGDELDGKHPHGILMMETTVTVLNLRCLQEYLGRRDLVLVDPRHCSLHEVHVRASSGPHA